MGIALKQTMKRRTIFCQPAIDRRARHSLAHAAVTWLLLISAVSLGPATAAGYVIRSRAPSPHRRPPLISPRVVEPWVGPARPSTIWR